VHERADGRCEFTDGRWRCVKAMTDPHHLAGRGGPDPHRLDNLVGLCREHHDFVHAHPAWAYEHGWMRSRLSEPIDGGAA
jgi:hypothetical protein